jgi:hypothetical protein
MRCDGENVNKIESENTAGSNRNGERGKGDYGKEVEKYGLTREEDVPLRSVCWTLRMLDADESNGPQNREIEDNVPGKHACGSEGGQMG